MLQMESKINVMDNSGVYTVKVISLYSKPSSGISDVVLTAVDKHRRGKVFNKKYLCLLTTCRFFKKRRSGIFVKFDMYNGVLLKDHETFLGSKFYGPVDVLCKKVKISKIHFLSKCSI